MSVSAPTDLTFRAEDHTYWWRGKRVPGVSEILKKVGLTKSYDGVDPFYAERGTATHLAIALSLANDLDESSLDEHVLPFFNAWKKFVKEEGYEPLEWETPIYSEKEKYACTFDHYGLLKGSRICLDVKCTKKHDPGADYQVCGQVFALADNSCVTEKQGILELHENETYTLCEYPVDLSVWPSIMTLYRRKIAKK